jgi:hypothetical protein
MQIMIKQMMTFLTLLFLFSVNFILHYFMCYLPVWRLVPPDDWPEPILSPPPAVWLPLALVVCLPGNTWNGHVIPILNAL